MRTLNFNASSESAPYKEKAGTVGLAVLAHILVLLAAAHFGQARFASGRDQPGPPARFFVDVSLPQLMQRQVPIPDAPASAAPTPAPAARPTLADVPRGTAEVLIVPRSDPDPVRLPPPPPAEAARIEAPPASIPEAVAVAVVPAAPAAVVSTPPAVAVAPPGNRDDTAKVISIESVGMSTATYTFPSLTGESAGEKPHVFRVEIGEYRDIQLAIVNHVIEQIRARYPNEINWDSRSRGGVVRLSMRREDHEALVKFLRLELFGKRMTSSYG